MPSLHQKIIKASARGKESMRKLATQMDISPKSMRITLKSDHKRPINKLQKHQRITDLQNQKRAGIIRPLMNFMKDGTLRTHLEMWKRFAVAKIRRAVTVWRFFLKLGSSLWFTTKKERKWIRIRYFGAITSQSYERLQRWWFDLPTGRGSVAHTQIWYSSDCHQFWSKEMWLPPPLIWILWTSLSGRCCNWNLSFLSYHFRGLKSSLEKT